MHDKNKMFILVFDGFLYNTRSFSCAYFYKMFLPCIAKKKTIPI